MVANVFEIGALGPESDYLIRNPQNWVAASHQRLQDGKHIIIPLEFKNRYTQINVFLVEPLAEHVVNFQKEYATTYNDTLHIIQCAVGGTDELRFMKLVDLEQLQNEMGRMAHFPEYFFLDNQGPGFYVPALTLDTLFQSLNAYPNILSVDVEGAELEVFHAYSFDPPPDAIIIDHHGSSLLELTEILTKNNYYIVDKEWQGERETLLAYPIHRDHK